MSQAKQLFQDPDFRNQLNFAEKRAWEAFENVCSNFLGNTKSEAYIEIVEDLLSSECALRCDMSLKLHFLQSHWDFFPGNVGAIYDEHSERSHQDISQTGKRYSGKWNQNVLSDYCWMLVQKTPTEECKRKENSISFSWYI